MPLSTARPTARTHLRRLFVVSIIKVIESYASQRNLQKLFIEHINTPERWWWKRCDANVAVGKWIVWSMYTCRYVVNWKRRWRRWHQRRRRRRHWERQSSNRAQVKLIIFRVMTIMYNFIIFGSGSDGAVRCRERLPAPFWGCMC